MYSSLSNQSYHLVHYFFAFTVLMIIWPKFIFRQRQDDRLTQLFSNFLKMTFLIIIMGYCLVLLKLWEWLSITAILFGLSLRGYLVPAAQDSRRRAGERVLMVLTDALDTRRFSRRNGRLREVVQGGMRFPTAFRWLRRQPADWLFAICGVVIVGVSVYVRFYDSFVHAAPAMSDSYVTLAWMKYIDERILFHDGIYPQGFHIYLDLLYKYATIDPLYVLKYTGPFNMICLLFGMYFATARITGNRWAGLTSMLIFGIVEQIYPSDEWIRQAATNSQEFAFVFIIPTLYFVYKYLRDGEKDDLWTAGAGCSVVGLVHSLAFGLLGIGVVSLLFFSLVVRQRLIKRIRLVVWIGLGSIVIALIPLGIGKLMGRDVHSSSAQYLTSTTIGTVTPPTLYALDYISLISILMIGATALLNRKRPLVALGYLGVFGYGLGTFLLHYVIGPYSHSELLTSRSGELWCQVFPLCIGVAAYSVVRGLQYNASKEWVVGMAAFASVVGTLVYVKPTPIIPYKMEWDSSVEAYLSINRAYLPKTWMIVSDEEGYAEVLGSGYHMYISDLVSHYDPVDAPITRIGDAARSLDIAPDIFIFYQKNIFELPPSNSVYSVMEPKYKERKAERVLLQDWLNKCIAAHHDVTVFYQDKNLIVFHLHWPERPVNEHQIIWDEVQ